MGNFALYTVGGLAVSIEIKKKARIKQLEAQVASIKADSQEFLEKARTLSDQLVTAKKELESTKDQLQEALMKLGAIVHILKPTEAGRGDQVRIDVAVLKEIMPAHSLLSFKLIQGANLKVIAEGCVTATSRMSQAVPVGTPTVNVRWAGSTFCVPKAACRVVPPNADI